MILAGPGSEGLARRLAQQTKGALGRAETKTFPDGEKYVRIVDDVDGPVVACQSLWPPDRLVDLLLLLDAARRAGGDPVIAVVPYLAYARQDRVFQPGEALSAQVVARAVDAYCDQFVTVDPHKADVLDYFECPTTAVSASGPVADALRERDVDCVLAPDEGALDRARDVAQRCGADVDHLEKSRVDSQTVRMRPKQLDVNGRRVAIVDDIISTGGTMATALNMLRDQGAKATYAVGVHGLFIGGAEDRLKKAGVDEILSTDTVPNATSRISVVEPVADALTATATKAQ